VQNTEQTQLFTRHDLAKIDKSLYTKEQYKKLKADKLARRNEKNAAKAIKKLDPNRKRSIVCLKHGDKYGPEYVNKLFSMCKKHSNFVFDFYCITENTKGIDPGVKIIPIKEQTWKGWWWKPYLFSSDLPCEGTILYMDLDVVISNDLEKLFGYYPGEFCIIRDFTRHMRPNWERYNSSVMRWEAKSLAHLWDTFKTNPAQFVRRHHGDQDYIWEQQKGARLWPDSWIMSWKWEIRKTKHFKPGGTRGNRVLQNVENVRPPTDCSICVFHGDPNPAKCEDPWVVENWHNV